jgi:hypothetical protein
LTGSREVQQMLARQAAEREERRVRWVKAAPPALAEAVVTWAGFPPRQTNTDGTPWYELAPQRILLAEPTESIFNALASASLTAGQLDGAAELFTSLEWTRSRRVDIPDSLNSLPIAHVTANGTDPMKFRMRHRIRRQANRLTSVGSPRAAMTWR